MASAFSHSFEHLLPHLSAHHYVSVRQTSQPLQPLPWPLLFGLALVYDLRYRRVATFQGYKWLQWDPAMGVNDFGGAQTQSGSCTYLLVTCIPMFTGIRVSRIRWLQLGTETVLPNQQELRLKDRVWLGMFVGIRFQATIVGDIRFQEYPLFFGDANLWRSRPVWQCQLLWRKARSRPGREHTFCSLLQRWIVWPDLCWFPFYDSLNHWESMKGQFKSLE